MSEPYVPAEVRQLVFERASFRCEYCLLPLGAAFFPHEVDHVVAVKHGGPTDVGNLALACWRCNRHKGTDLGSFDPQTGEFSLLFNPRRQTWTDHFAFKSETLVGLTYEGRTTIFLLRLNSEERLAERRRIVILPPSVR